VGVSSRPVRLNLSARLINHCTMFFFHNKTVSAGLSATKTISRTASKFHCLENNATKLSTETSFSYPTTVNGITCPIIHMNSACTCDTHVFKILRSATKQWCLSFTYRQNKQNVKRMPFLFDKFWPSKLKRLLGQLFLQVMWAISSILRGPSLMLWPPLSPLISV
jgi:hypothetical protein